MSRIFEYFVVCGIGPEIRSIDGTKGYQGTGCMYFPSLLDQYPPSTHSLYPPPPPQLPTCVLPAGVEFHSSGFDPNDPSTFPRSYPIVLTEGDGSKIYVSCISFRDPVCEDIAEAYRIQANSYADKCICLVSRSPSFSVLRSALEELFALCFSPNGSRYSLLTLASEAICHLIYPFRWQHVYIPLLFYSGVDYIDAPTPYMMGLYSGVDISALAMDGVVVVDLEYNRITTSEEIPPIPEPELSFLRGEIMNLLQPSVIGIDQMKAGMYSNSVSEHFPKSGAKQWGDNHDLQLRMIFLKFFATFLSGYRNFLENSATHVFNTQAFLKKRSRSTNQPSEPMIAQFLDSHGFMDYLERGVGFDENNNNVLDKLQDAIGRGQNLMSVFPTSLVEPEILTVSDSAVGISGSGAKYTYDRFPSNIRTEEQEEKRKQILATISNAFEYSGRHAPSSKDPLADNLSPLERAAERELMVLDIKVKLQGLWLRLLKLGATDDPLSSFEYGTILALIESDAEGIGGSGFVECIREHIHSGWHCQLTEEQFIAVKELLKTAINRATSRNDLLTIRDALEVSSDMYKKDSNNVPDYVQRHLISLSIWEELRFWEGYFDYLMEQSSNKSANYASLVTAQLVVLASHMAGLGLPDNDAWYMIETIAERNSIGSKQFIKIRGFLSHIQQLRNGYWGFTSMKAQSALSLALPSPHSKNAKDEDQQPTEATGVGRNWVQSMFSRNTTSRSSSFSRVRRWTSDGGNSATNENGTPRKQDLSTGGQKKLQTNVRILRGHNGAITALHCVTKREVWDLVGDREDAGFFISGSTDCSVKIWDPSLRGSELRATLKGHTRTVRAISSDRGKVVSGSDDHSVLVWDKQTTQLLEELKGHEGPVSCVRTLSGERVLTASHDGTVKMWDVRTDRCVATVGRCSSAVLCMEYDDNVGILAAAGRDVVANMWDIRASKQMHKLSGHTQWIRSLRMVGDTVITGSDDWTARIWSVSRGTCDAVLACHAGPILCVEYSSLDRGIITGSTDGLLRFWENDDGGIRCAKNVTVHNAAILSINAGEHWLGIGAADNSLSLFHRPQERLGSFSGPGSKMAGWQLYRTPQKTVAMVRCIASDLERKRICSGGRNGLLRLWDATINI
ncbi:DENN domain and WD repeat-containing protein SCD1 isoform X3 [Cicer arietinum]|uniref:DENN domain and WD repeat-containing protein SCD1 isoform X3 n=1 Tax=Cicer arietinum TaxID=3827 RepID=UPI003CC57924